MQRSRRRIRNLEYHINQMTQVIETLVEKVTELEAEADPDTSGALSYEYHAPSVFHHAEPPAIFEGEEEPPVYFR
jgi:hypothetical protein